MCPSLHLLHSSTQMTGSCSLQGSLTATRFVDRLFFFSLADPHKLLKRFRLWYVMLWSAAREASTDMGMFYISVVTYELG